MFTDYYVANTATGGGVGTELDPLTFAEGLAIGGPSIRVWVKGGDYGTISGGSMVAGDSSGMSLLIGYTSVIGDISTPVKSEGEIKDTTGFPIITLDSDIIPAAYCGILNLDLTGDTTTAPIYTTAEDAVIVYNCSIENTGVGYGLRLDDDAQVLFNDIKCTNASHLQVFDADTDVIVIGNRLEATDGVVICEVQTGVIEDNFIIGPSTAIGVFLKQFTALSLIKNNTLEGLDTHIQLDNAAVATTLPCVISNMATDANTFIESLYSATANNMVVEVGNRTRDNTTERVGISDGIIVCEVTTDTGGPETDYTDYANGDLTLIDDSPAVGSGLGFGTWNIGAAQNSRVASEAGSGLTTEQATWLEAINDRVLLALPSASAGEATGLAITEDLPASGGLSDEQATWLEEVNTRALLSLPEAAPGTAEGLVQNQDLPSESDQAQTTSEYIDANAAFVSNLTSVKTTTDRLDALIEDSDGDRFTEKALEAAPSGTVSATDVNIVSVAGAEVTSVDDFKADVSLLALESTKFDPTVDEVEIGYTWKSAFRRLLSVDTGKTTNGGKSFWSICGTKIRLVYSTLTDYTRTIDSEDLTDV
jgi:hypothetical protein